jgi:hypothetical protein
LFSKFPGFLLQTSQKESRVFVSVAPLHKALYVYRTQSASSGSAKGKVENTHHATLSQHFLRRLKSDPAAALKAHPYPWQVNFSSEKAVLERSPDNLGFPISKLFTTFLDTFNTFNNQTLITLCGFTEISQ